MPGHEAIRRVSSGEATYRGGGRRVRTLCMPQSLVTPCVSNASSSRGQHEEPCSHINNSKRCVTDEAPFLFQPMKRWPNKYWPPLPPRATVYRIDRYPRLFYSRPTLLQRHCLEREERAINRGCVWTMLWYPSPVELSHTRAQCACTRAFPAGVLMHYYTYIVKKSRQSFLLSSKKKKSKQFFFYKWKKIKNTATTS